MDRLTALGLVALSLMLVAHALDSAVGFLRGAWPFGLVEAV